MEQKTIAKRIREERERCGLSQQELAELMGWKSHASLVAIENGNKEVKAWELFKFAEILKVSPESLYSEIQEDLQPTIFWRKKGDNEKSVLLEEKHMIQCYEDYRLVERLVAENLVKKLPQEVCDIHEADTTWANRLAEKIHRKFSLGNYPAELLQQCLEEEYGILLLSKSLENGSASCYRDEFGAVILLNEREVPWRQSFNLAHELFHLITWDNQLIQKIKTNSDLFKKNEKLADAFAAALLMPQQMLDLDIQGNELTYSFIVALAMKYRVSKQAMLWRLCYLRYISNKAVENILADEDFLKLDHFSFKKSFQSIPSFSNRFVRLAYLAYEKGRLSKGRLAQMLQVKLRDVGHYLLEKGFYLTDDKKITITFS
jgi:Zn-dependent peptidase ImmA (M78 family)/DNA-binding XRE family transcriptional regulator